MKGRTNPSFSAMLTARLSTQFIPMRTALKNGSPSRIASVAGGLTRLVLSEGETQ